MSDENKAVPLSIPGSAAGTVYAVTAAVSGQECENSIVAVPPARFDPLSLGLPEEFILTDYTRLKGCSCKLPQPKLLALLHAVTPEQPGAGMDCSIVPLHRYDTTQPQPQSLFLVSTTDFFFPSVDDPFLQGQIGAANVLSDLYSTGISECDTVLMLLAASTDMDEVEREVVTREMMRGFVERVTRAGAVVTGGQTVMNPWPLIGGVAMRVAAASEMIPQAGRMSAGDVLVLTKPLGGQVAVNLYQWLRRPSPLYETCIRGVVSEEDIEKLYHRATRSMARLNRHAARLMHSHGAHGATDVTGFGILGHARNLALAQSEVNDGMTWIVPPPSSSSSLSSSSSPVDVAAAHGLDRVVGKEVCVELDVLPMYATAVQASHLIQDKYRLLEGYSAETSGGLLVAFGSMQDATNYLRELALADAVTDGWVVGRVVARRTADEPHARLSKNCRIMSV